MFTFIIKYDQEIDFFGMTNLYFYRYFQEKKIKIINIVEKDSEKQGDDSKVVKKNLFDEIKFYIHNNHIREYQIIFIQKIFQENNREFGGNITNRYEGIEKDLLERLSEDKISPTKTNFVVIDNVERDFKNVARDISASVGEELDRYGHVRIPSFTYEEINEISEIWNLRMKAIKDISFTKTNPEQMSFEERELIEPLREIINYIDEMVKNKIEKIENSEMGKIDDSAVRKHIAIYRMINRYITDNLRGEFKRIDENFKKIDLKERFIMILCRNNYYFEYLFTKRDIEILEEAWDSEKISMQGEQHFNLSYEIVDKLKERKKKIELSFEEILRRKREALKFLEMSKQEKERNSRSLVESEKSIYSDRYNLKWIEETFKKEFFDSYLNKIIEDKNLNDKNLYSPKNAIVSILKRRYSLNRIKIYNGNFFRIPFKNDNSKNNEYLLKLVYFILFLVEYSEQKLSYLGERNYYSFENIDFKVKYMESLFSKYVSRLESEKNYMELQQSTIKSSSKISYFATKDGDYRDYANLDVTKIDTPKFGILFKSNDVDRFKRDWINQINRSIDNYIEKAEEALNDYQKRKNNLDIKSSIIIEKDIEEEVLIREKELEKCRKNLEFIGRGVSTDINNEFKEKIRENKEILKLKNCLDKRPRIEDIVYILAIPGILEAVSYGYYFIGVDILGIFMRSSIAVVITAFILGYFIIKNKSKIENILNFAKEIRNSYITALGEKYDIKKKYIDSQTECKAAEKNYILVKKEQSKVFEQLKCIRFYISALETQVEAVSSVVKLIKNISAGKVDEIAYDNEYFSGKISSLDCEKAPFQNDIFLLGKYIEIPQYTEFKVNVNHQENWFKPTGILGCNSIDLKEDEIFGQGGNS
ncbi:MAG: hypothetical protein ACRCZ9_03040 [Fusobacteriaceae bacterium]